MSPTRTHRRTVDWGSMPEWEMVLPPSRPDLEDLLRIRHVASSLPRGSKVAVLGSTPEFCDLFAEMELQTYIFDKSLEFHKMSLGLRIHPTWGTLVNVDWLFGLPTDEFALVVSDLTSGNITYDQRDTFYRAITNTLISGGVFMDKVLTNEAPLFSPDELRTAFRDTPVNLRSINDFSCAAIFCSTLQLDDRIIDTERIYASLSRSLRGARFETLIAGAKRITPPGNTWYYGIEWSSLSSGYCPDLSFVARHRVGIGTPYEGRAYQYHWRKD